MRVEGEEKAIITERTPGQWAVLRFEATRNGRREFEKTKPTLGRCRVVEKTKPIAWESLRTAQMNSYFALKPSLLNARVLQKRSKLH